ncbi:hypothetical protein Lser_V15G43056 [Lactuca serriola]
MKHIHSLRFHTWFFVIIVFLVLSHGGSLHPHHFIHGEKITHGDHQIHSHPKKAKIRRIISNRVKHTRLLTRLWAMFSMQKGDDKLQVSDDRIMSSHL